MMRSKCSTLKPKHCCEMRLLRLKKLQSQRRSKKRTMPNHRYRMDSEVLLYPSIAGWHFLSLPQKQSEEIKKTFAPLKRGWGSLPVHVTIGTTHWSTSIFPDKKSGTYLLPLKADVRKKDK